MDGVESGRAQIGQRDGSGGVCDSDGEGFVEASGVVAGVEVLGLSERDFGKTMERYREAMSGLLAAAGGGTDESVDDAGTKLILLRLMPAPKTRCPCRGRK